MNDGSARGQQRDAEQRHQVKRLIERGAKGRIGANVGLLDQPRIARQERAVVLDQMWDGNQGRDPYHTGVPARP